MKGEDAQITIDYVAGMGIFLLSVAFVFQFMYNLFVPFQSSSDEATLAADRASAVLVERLLAANGSGTTNVIDQGKLYYFNSTKMNRSSETDYKSTLREVGIYSNESIFDLNVSVAYLNGTVMKRVNTNFPLISGPPLPDNIDIGQTRRLVLIVNTSTGYNEMAILAVRVW